MNKVEEPSGSRTMQALDYYNSNVLRSKVSSALRSSCNDRQGGGGLDHCHYSSHHRRTHDSLYRSNSSLELMHDQHILLSTSGGNGGGSSGGLKPNTPVLRREYGSHGSIDVIANSERSLAAAESLMDMFAEYSKPGGNKDSTSSLIEDEKATSPKVRLKLTRFWGSSSGASGAGGSGSGATGGGTNISSGNGNGKQQRQGSVEEAMLVAATTTSTANHQNEEERQRRRAFAHYDCRSVTANLGYAAKVRSILLSKRRNTTTGASAASTLGARSSTPDGGGDSGDEDHGDGNCNSLVESCPYFRNELGGEEERVIGLMRGTRSVNGKLRPHRPVLACGLSVLEFPVGQSHWTHGPVCPYGQATRPIESVDHGALYYRKYFYQQEHQNWFGMDDNLGPVAISIRRERVEKQPNSSTSTGGNNAPTHMYRYRLLIRTSELLTLRGSVLEDAIPNLKPTSSSKTLNTKEVLEYAAPEVQISCLRLGIGGAATEDALLKLDEQGLSRHYKVGVMYCKAGQSTEEQMYNNQEVGPALTEFLDTIGTTVRLKGFEQYKAGLDNKTDSTGLYSVYSQYQDCEIMFHVSTMLPFTPNNRQQLLRKRHIGNDIVTIVFQEPGAHPFTPKVIRSQFQHVFIVVRAISPCTENTRYSVAVARSKEVPIFGPPIPEGATFPKSKAFADFLLAKIINGENAAHQSEKFATMATRTRQEYLKDLVSNYTTATVVEPNQKFSMLSFSSKKKTERWRPRFVPGDAVIQGAIVWQVIVDDCGLSQQLDAFLAISADSIVIIEEASREIVFVTSCKSVLGWSANANSLRLYFHQGECITFHMREGGERDELMEVVVRLRTVTNGSIAQEFSLKRNPLGQLGFHVQPDGVVTQVENMGLAYMAGLRQGARLVEICKVAVSTLSHDQMVDLLKTSVAVTVTVIPPLADGTPRRGCSIQNCKYNTTYEGDYENVNNNANDTAAKVNNKTARQQAVTGNVRKRYERSFSPPRSSNSSGYGTGSSSKSSASVDRFANIEGTLTSSSSGHSLDDRWYEVLESGVEGVEGTSPPPPLPIRLNNPYIHPAHPTNSHSKMNGFSMLEPSQHEFKVGEKVTCLIKAERSHELRRQIERNHSDYHLNQVEYGHYQLTTSNSVDEKTLQDSASNISRPQSDGGHSTDTSSTSDRMFGLPSEDDLSGGKGSPVVRRNKSQSKEATGQQQPARLRQIPRSQRNSANLQSSTFQQDLLRLIHPDYMEPNDLQAISTSSLKENSNTYGKIPGNGGGSLSNLTSDSSTTTLCSDISVENKSRPHSPPTKDKPSPPQPQLETIVTLARPATVISNPSTASSPAPSEAKMTKEERLSPRVSKPGQVQSKGPLLLPDRQDMDWSSLVDTATRAMLHADLEPTDTSTPREEELAKHISQLESRLSRETRRRISLEEEVKGLREENRRLQQESQSAAQQLRRFTEWFFQTIDKQ